MNILLSDNQLHLRFAPLTLTRPLAELRCGLFTNAERWKHLLPNAKIGYQTENYLQAKFKAIDGLWINAQIIPNPQLALAVQQLGPNEALAYKGIRLAQNGSGSNLLEYTASELLVLENRWDLFLKNDIVSRRDFELYTKAKKSQTLSASNLLIGAASELFISEGARIEGATLNTSTGPIYVGKNVEIMEGSMLRGPLAILDGAVIKMGAKIYGATTIGPECRIGGEVSNSIFQGHTNKGHDGFIGNALIGEWCNLGADTNCSNLKNNYGKVSTYSYETRAQVQTSELFMGLTMGDHSKTAINVQFNTASVVGVSSNILCSGFPEKVIGSFQWLSDGQKVLFELQKAKAAAAAMMARRNQEFTELDAQIFDHLANN
ncbi:MAG: glucose-1-phosphate thymidylyltransferase [Sphingomonadales bacterium]|nr:glucose-1-phosphate thymidylyltransferase [Sphingomonadales bacterium]